MAQRVRRANAGNRLHIVLAEQIPADDPDAELFAERDDDEDFDIEAEEERLRREREAAEQASQSQNEDEEGGSEDESDGDHSDSNFSSSTDSDSDRDEEPQDAGEAELRKQQRQNAREKRKAERNKMFKIKKRPAPEESEKPKEPKKKRVFTSADIILEKGRHSERKSALRNKRHLIEQMKEAERRRAQYVPPQRKKAPKLTQEQRLEEAKKTEARNLSSLNKLVEIEEERKHQQRLAMINARPKLTHFVRFHSAQFMEEPKLIEVVEKDVDLIKTDENEPSANGPADSTNTIKQEVPENYTSGETAVKTEVPSHQNGTVQEEQPVDREAKPSPSGEGEGEVIAENEKEEEDKVLLYGPPHLRTYDFLTFHEFPDVHINKYSIRSIVLGPIASAHHQPPLKRMCPFTGREARYLDPQTGVAYSDFETNKLLKSVPENKLGWSKELGGVFTLNGKPARHAKGVPEGFF